MTATQTANFHVRILLNIERHRTYPWHFTKWRGLLTERSGHPRLVVGNDVEVPVVMVHLTHCQFDCGHPICAEALTAIKDELQLDQLHVDKVGCYSFMGETHANVLHLHQIPLQRVVQPILQSHEVRNLELGWYVRCYPWLTC